MKTLALMLFLPAVSFAQDKTTYSRLTEDAFRLFEQKDYLQAGQKYAEAFAVYSGPDILGDRVDAATAWALAGVPDSAFAQLFILAGDEHYRSVVQLRMIPSLQSLHTDARWNEVIAKMQRNKEKLETHLDQPLVAMLDSIHVSDQLYRQQLTDVAEKHGWESEQVKALWKVTGVQDSLNLIQIKQLLDTRGWLGPETIGEEGNSTLFLVIQHADQQTQEKYLPMMRTAVQNGKAQAAQLALLEDRVALGQGKRQIYGSQIGRNPTTGEFYVQPLEDPDNVDQRRAQAGLPPLASYTAFWNFTWDPAAYKKQLRKIEKLEKKQRKKYAQ